MGHYNDRHINITLTGTSSYFFIGDVETEDVTDALNMGKGC